MSSFVACGQVVHLWGPLQIWRDFCYEDKVQREEDALPLESRHLKSRLREVHFEEGCPCQLHEPWVERSLGHSSVVVALGYTVRRAKRKVHAALFVDWINEVDWLLNISLKVLVGKCFMWTSREYSDEPTAFASTGKNVCWRCSARTFIGWF